MRSYEMFSLLSELMQQVVLELHKVDYFCHSLGRIYAQVSPPGGYVILRVKQETNK